MTGLFENCDFNHNAVDGWHKGRWRILSRDLKESRELFEALRTDDVENKRKLGFVIFHPNTPNPKIINDNAGKGGREGRGREGGRGLLKHR